MINVRACLNLFICFLITLFSSSVYARCTSTGVTQTEDNRTALIPFGKINVFDTYFSPVGSSLGSVSVPPTNYTYGGANASSVLWTCDASDLSDISFLVATNGDDRVGGYYDIGAADGMSDVYATYFAYVGLKQTMDGVTISRYWKKVPVKSYATSGSKIQIRLQDLPTLQAELFRVSSLPGTSAASSYCLNNNTQGSGIVYGTTTGDAYSCIQPNAYIQLAGPGLIHDEAGEDSASHYDFWGVDNGFGYGMRNVNRLYNTPTCVARSATPLVMLPTISVDELNNGQSSSAPFNVSVECSNSVTSGTSNAQTAMGFQVSAGAYSAAQKLGLVNSNGGVSMLLSDNYDAAISAKGVGITIAYASEPSTPLWLLGATGLDPLNGSYMGNLAGWYPVLKNATAAGTTVPGYTQYNYQFIATLKKISAQTVSTGQVRATATVLVKVQ